MVNAVAVALGGAIGASMRYLVGEFVSARMKADFPFQTMLVNVTGAFLLGLAMAMIAERELASDWWRLFLGVGMLGGYTTFSTFAFETVDLMQKGAVAGAVANVIGSVVLAVLAAAAGLYVGRLF